MTSFCVRCKSKTGDVNPRSRMTKNNRAMVQSDCALCGTTKSRFVSAGVQVAATKGKRKQKGGNPLALLASMFL